MERERTPIRTHLFGLLLVAVASSAPAQGDFTNGDLVGSYGISASTDNVSEATILDNGDQFGATMLGVLHADGFGNVSGRRTFQRTTSIQVGFSHPRHQHVEVVEQTVTGTYEINADGTGIMRLTPEPNPPWEVPTQQLVTITFTGGGPEVVRFVLAEDGRSFRFTQEIRTTRQEAGVFRDTHFVLKGVAETQEPLEIPEPEPDPRIDELIGLLEGQDARIDELTDLVASQSELLARQSAQLCELLRLVNTPQGQRETSTPEVLDACGTAFAWNGEGTEGPRRGR